MNSSLDKIEVRKLFSEEEIKATVKRIAEQIAIKYLPILEKEGDKFRLLFVGVLKGGEPFASDLAREVSRIFPAVYILKDYISVASRNKDNKSGEVRLLLDTRQSIKGIYVIIVEDIVDTGATMAYLWPQFLSHKPAGLELCSLINKIPEREKEIEIHYVGFELPKPLYVVGYGLDSKERFRGLPFIGYIPDEQD